MPHVASDNLFGISRMNICHFRAFLSVGRCSTTIAMSDDSIVCSGLAALTIVVAIGCIANAVKAPGAIIVAKHGTISTAGLRYQGSTPEQLLYTLVFFAVYSSIGENEFSNPITTATAAVARNNSSSPHSEI